MLEFTGGDGVSVLYDAVGKDAYVGNVRMSAEVFEMIAAGVLKPNISREYTLDEIAQAHIDIAGRETTGAIILTF